MPYIGRELDRGNYLKLDDISSSFNGSTTTFNLTAGGKAFFPGSAFSILVSLAGVTQEPEAAYQINDSQIIFATAPVAGDQFFCIVLGLAHGVSVPGNGSVNGAQLAKPFNYDGYFYLDDANNRVGVGTATPSKPLHVVGEGQFDSVRVLGDLTVDGTTTTLDTVVTEVDRLEVGANNSTVGLAVTQSGSGHAAIFMGGKVGVGVAAPTVPLTVSSSADHSDIAIFHAGGGTPNRGLKISTFSNTNANAGVEFDAQMSTGAFKFSTGGTERIRIDADGRLLLGATSSGASALADDLVISKSGHTGMTIRSTDGNNSSIYFADGTSGNAQYRGWVEYHHPSDSMRFGTSATERLKITSAGSVGIGTITPQSQFEVYGTSPIVRSKHSTSQKYTQINHNGTDGYLDWSSGNLIFRGASNAERLRITSGGSVGIGTDAPANKLSISDPGYTGIELQSDRTTATDNIGGLHFRTLSTNVAYIQSLVDGTVRIRNTSSLTERLRITSAGKIGINDASPERTLDVVGANCMIQLEGSGGSGRQYSLCSTDNTTGAAVGAAGQFVIYDDTSGDNRLNINSTGNIGINESSPGTTLHVKSTDASSITQILDTGNAQVSLVLRNSTSTGNNIQLNANGNDFRILTNASERLRIDSAGKIGVGGLTTPGALLSIPAGESNTPRFAIESAVDDNDFTITQYEDGNGTYTMLGQNVKLNSGGNNTILDSGHKTAGILFDARNHGAITFLTGGTNAVTEPVKITSDGNLNIINGNLQIGGTNILNSGRALYNVEQIKLADTKELVLGSSDDLKIYHDGSNSYIDDAGTGALFVRGSYLAFAGINGEQLINAEQNAAVELFHNNSRKFQTTTTGAKVTGNFEPEADATRDLGSASLRWANIYSADLQLSNEGAANDVDGTWGQYTIQEGEDDLFLINRRNGKKYKFMLQEVN